MQLVPSIKEATWTRRRVALSDSCSATSGPRRTCQTEGRKWTDYGPLVGTNGRLKGGGTGGFRCVASLGASMRCCSPVRARERTRELALSIQSWQSASQQITPKTFIRLKCLVSIKGWPSSAPLFSAHKIGAVATAWRTCENTLLPKQLVAEGTLWHC